jgi:DNA-binding IclR family transcriptional regulator
MAGNELPTDDRDGDTSVEVTDSLMYGLEILGLYKPGVTALSTSEIAKRIGLPQKRARQLIGTLANSRFIVPLGKADRYRPDAVLRRLNSSFRDTPVQDENRLQAAAAPILGELAGRANASVVLGVRSELWIRCLNCWLPAHSSVRTSPPEASLIYESPLGLAWIAAEARESRFALLHQIETEVPQEVMGRVYRTIGDLMDNGFCHAYDDPKSRLTLAAAVRVNGTVVASISCSRLQDEELGIAEMGELLLEAVGRLAAAL